MPQMNIGIYQKHAFLITNLDKVTNNYSCAECQARFTQACNCSVIQRRATKGRRKGSAEGKKKPARIGVLKRILSVGGVWQQSNQLAGILVETMERSHSLTNVQQCWGTNCAGHAVDGFCLEQRTVFQFYGLPLAQLSGLLFGPEIKTGKNNTQKSWENSKIAHKGNVVRAHFEKKARDSRDGF